jgi:hypothetical protein
VFSYKGSFGLGQVVFDKKLIPAKGAFFNWGGEKCGLIVQAQAFASYLKGPIEQEKKEVVIAQRKPPARTKTLPKPRFVPSAKFKLEGTSYYPNQPDRSIALITEPGGLETNQRWIKEGERLGLFVIHEIRRGVVVYRDQKDQLHEMSIERKIATRSLVRDHISSLTSAQTPSGRMSGPSVESDSH